MRSRLRRLSLRGRLMFIGVAGVALALALGGFVMYGVLLAATNRTLDNEALASARQVAALARSKQLPDPVPVSGSQLVQVVDSHNRVLGASGNADRLTALLGPREVSRAESGVRLTVPGSRAGLTGPLRVVAVPAGAGETVLVAQQVGDVARSQELLRNTLLVTYPLLLVVLAAIAWFVIGRTLRPVDALRLGADRISGAARDERLPVPESADEIHALAITLNVMLDRLAAARGRQRAFVADAAHELRSPLSSIRTQLEVSQRLGEGGELADNLLADVARLAALVEDLLLLARSDTENAPPSRVERFEVTPLLDEVADRHGDDRVPVTVATAAAPVTVSANRDELRRVLANLVDNAVRHATSEVRLEAANDGARTLLIVSDDGPGISAQDRPRVFERFTRLDDARDRDAGGTGLGLPIVHELLRRADGSVLLEDNDDDRAGGHRGLRAVVRLPR